jgi:3-hydroxyisobutyrate dehydrogenase-like beta-hydroxyacid dehydrogenase
MADYKAVGFVGLGAMGAPMVGHLANKLPAGIPIHIFDVVQSVVEDTCKQNPDRVFAGSGARDVADKSVWEFSSRVICAST